MRVIAGEFRGRRLVSPDNYDIRPTTDKVKEAVFSIIYPYITEDSVFTDVFSGTGGMALEAISRGARKAYLGDQSREALRIIKENVKLCKAEDRVVILAGDFRNNIARMSEKSDFFFIDPPYAAGYILPTIDCILEKDKLAEGGLIICEHDKHDVMPEEYSGLKAIKVRTYGKTTITIYTRTEE